jgi:hydroxyacylglutathione hydrolase
MNEFEFVQLLTADQPFAPTYFGYDVELNKKGAPAFGDSIKAVSRPGNNLVLEENVLLIDTRPKEDFRKAHVKGAINLQDGAKFETWLGSIISPDEKFYLIAGTEADLDIAIEKTAKIGYEPNIKAAFLLPDNANERSAVLDFDDFKTNPDNYTIIDVRNWGEINEGKAFENALTIPLPELRGRLDEIPTDKPIIVHCAAGYRSAAAVSIVAAKINTIPVYDLGEAIEEFLVHSPL